MFTFQEWRTQVGEILLDEIGMHLDDLPDMMYYDYFEDGLSPQEVADIAIAEFMPGY